MATFRLRWKRDKVVQIAVKKGVSVVAQLLDEPNLLFFDVFFPSGEAPNVHLEASARLFCCAVTRQFLQHSVIGTIAGIAPVPGVSVPGLRVMGHLGSRRVTAWAGTKHERQFVLLSGKPGGLLREHDALAPASAGVGRVLEELAPEDFHKTTGIELDCIWTFPLLNERLHLSHTTGIAVDPLMELTFDRPPRPEYRTFVDILACHGSLADWGYEVHPPI
jgi:hypothetical protein